MSKFVLGIALASTTLATAPVFAEGLEQEVRGFESRQWPELHVGDKIDGLISDSDLEQYDGTHAKVYVFNARAGETITIHYRSEGLVTRVFLVADPEGPYIDQGNDSGWHDSVLSYTFPSSRKYWLVAGSLYPATGAFTLSISGAANDQTTLVSDAAAIAACNDEDKKYTRDQQIDGCNIAIRYNKANVTAYYNRGIVRLRNSDYADAISDFTFVIGQKPTVSEAYSGRGAAHFYQKDYSSALDDVNQAIRLDARNARAFLMRSMVEQKLGKDAEAKADYRHAHDLDPEVAN